MFIVILQSHRGRDVRLAVNVYHDTSLFSHITSPDSGSPSRDSENDNRKSDDTKLISKVIAAKVMVDGMSVSDLGSNNVTTVFKPVRRVKDECSNEFECVYWDFTAKGGRGGWNSDGCRMDFLSESGRFWDANVELSP